jgi:Ca-activated chloride channel family protein
MPPTFKPSKDTLKGLYLQSHDGKRLFSLKHTEVQAKIAGNLSRVELTQTFQNPFTEMLEAIYVFLRERIPKLMKEADISRFI